MPLDYKQTGSYDTFLTINLTTSNSFIITKNRVRTVSNNVSVLSETLIVLPVETLGVWTGYE